MKITRRTRCFRCILGRDFSLLSRLLKTAEAARNSK